MSSKPWHRQKGETAKAYAAFCVYYQMAPSERSIDAAWKAATNQQGSGKHATGTWTKWSTKYDWVSRAAAHDEHLAEQDRLLWEERRAELRRRDWDQADALRAVVEEAIPEANGFVRRRVVKGKDGAPDTVYLAFSIDALARVLVEASKVQRLATNEPTDNINLTGAALDAFIARQLARLADGGEAEVGGEAGPDAAGADGAADGGA